jgi:hypothetical protein
VNRAVGIRRPETFNNTHTPVCQFLLHSLLLLGWPGMNG